jgi:endonuclease/exonuclease/phosphatase family metal-dependent hydrolase
VPRHIPQCECHSGEWCLKSAGRGQKFESHKLELAALDRRGRRGCSRPYRTHRPDLLLLQEATEELAELPARVGGCFFREPLDGRIYGLAVWSPHPLAPPYALPLPVSQVPGRVPPRVAQIVQWDGVAFANVHLSHGQLLNRWQLLHIANALDGPAAIIGDYNAIGPIKLARFKDIGPRQPTHSPTNIISFRLDRCMARGLRCSYARVLGRGPSDHHPIRLDLQVLPGVRVSDGSGTAHVRRLMLRASVDRWVRAMSDSRPRPTAVSKVCLISPDQPRRTWRRWAAPSSSIGIDSGLAVTVAPSSSAAATPHRTLCGFSTTIS